MTSFVIEGGHPLSGSIRPQGAKNEALEVICASLLTREEVRLEGVPAIRDVEALLELLERMGVEIERPSRGVVCLKAERLDEAFLESDDFLRRSQALRGSVMLIGPLLARMGRAVIAKPGGDKIGRRRLDTHILGLTSLGATLQKRPVTGQGADGRSGPSLQGISPDPRRDAPLRASGGPTGPHPSAAEPIDIYDKDGITGPSQTGDVYEMVAPGGGLRGSYMLLDEASVTGTANIVMAASQARGETTIYNAASEPYVQQLCRMLCQMGARIEGIGSNLLKIHGMGEGLAAGRATHCGRPTSLRGTTHRIMPDIIETGSFIGMAAMCGHGILIEGAGPMRELGLIPEAFSRLGVRMEERDGGDIFVPRHDHYEISTFLDGTIMTLADAPWPGLTPDLLSVLIVVATQARGSALFHQKMFESRLFFVDKLIDMGAQIILCDPHRAVVIGHDHHHRLHGGRMASPDIRAGIALLIAAMSAEGESRIDNIEQIDRGYEDIEHRLGLLGARIKRVKS